MSFIEQCLGVGGLLNGQSFDLHYSTLPRTLDTTERIARGKTVSLIRLTLVLPAMLGEASDRELHQIERISVFWGLSYQIVDDLKDVLQSSAQTGKTSARDLMLDRPNIATVIGIRGAVRRLTRLIDLGDRALSSLLISRPELDFLERLRGELQARTCLGYRGTPVRWLRETGRDLSEADSHKPAPTCVRSLISIAGIAFSVAAMLTVVTILQGAIGMFSSILSTTAK